MNRINEQAGASLATNTSLSGAISGSHSVDFNNFSHPSSGVYAKARKQRFKGVGL